MIIEFLTLFLHLVGGVHRVELAVGPQVAAVEIRVDREPLLTLEGPPWVFELDLGRTLEPHLLEAVARDSEGREIARARQAINLPRAPVEARLAMDYDAGGHPVAVRVAWEATTDDVPSRVSVRCDAHVLERAQRGRYPLPPIDLDTPHIISAELSFPNKLSATAQAAVGGGYGSEVRTVLTAVPVQLEPGSRPSLLDLKLSLANGGRRLQVVALERPGFRLFVVTDPHAYPRLQRHARMLGPGRSRAYRHRLVVEGRRAQVEDDLAVLVHPRAESQTAHGEQRLIFPHIGPLSLATEPLPWVLSHVRPEDLLTREPRRIADAVACAGVSAAGTTAPRAVLLLTAGTAADYSQYTRTSVRRYLAHLRVPFQVWSVDGADCSWEGAIDVSSPAGLRGAAAALEAMLDSQWIAWVEGRYHPHEITLDGFDPLGSQVPPRQSP